MTQRQKLSAVRNTLIDARSDLQGVATGQAAKPRIPVLKAYQALCKAIDGCTDALSHKLADEL